MRATKVAKRFVQLVVSVELANPTKILAVCWSSVYSMILASLTSVHPQKNPLTQFTRIYYRHCSNWMNQLTKTNESNNHSYILIIFNDSHSLLLISTNLIAFSFDCIFKASKSRIHNFERKEKKKTVCLFTTNASVRFECTANHVDSSHLSECQCVCIEGDVQSW